MENRILEFGTYVCSLVVFSIAQGYYTDMSMFFVFTMRFKDNSSKNNQNMCLIISDINEFSTMGVRR